MAVSFRAILNLQNRVKDGEEGSRSEGGVTPRPKRTTKARDSK